MCAMKPTKLVYTETPQIPICILRILRRYEIVHKQKIVNLWLTILATPFITRPIELGADGCAFSNKYLNDTETSSQDLLLEKEHIDNAKLFGIKDLTGLHLPIRCIPYKQRLKTLELRCNDTENAMKVAEFLEHKAVKRLFILDLNHFTI